ncbi:ester cyclase [Haloferax sp. S1W]|uniref:ester cyclase n=1 Tax=Haloferax sp. S1W TaxID=3377110 RepID=UPI0037CB27C9
MATTTPEETNKALVRKVYEEFLNEKNYDVIEELYASDFVAYRAKGVEMPRASTLEDLEADARVLHEAFPDFTATIEELVAEDDTVVSRLTITGTHEGEFRDIAPTGEEVTYEQTSFFRVEDGKFVEAWVLTDTLAFMQQLGSIEAPDK